jgi:hydrogenase nickel incorporation protein HypA/HybF
MHELGIVFYAIDAIEKVARDNNAKKVVSATLELGEVSTVVPEYFMDLWNWEINRRPLMKGCELNLVTLKAITFCEDCEKTYSTVEHGRTCPYCGSKKTYLLSGKEINLRDIKVI